jgi:ABC-type sugar transport system permease subunit
MYYPAWTALQGAFTYWDGFNPPQFVGLENFRRAFTDPVLRISTVNNLIWVVIGIALALIPPFLVAELIFFLQGQRKQYVYRTLFVIPIIVPSIVLILLWTYFYRGDGLINQLLGIVGLERFQTLWIGNPDTALYALILMGFPWINAFNLLILYAGLQGISKEVLEAARLEGATGWRRVWAIDIPLIMPQVRLLLILAIIANVQNIVAPLVMTDGGPGYSTYVPALHMYKTAVAYGEFGYSMAISFLLFVVVLGLTVISQRSRRDRA